MINYKPEFRAKFKRKSIVVLKLIANGLEPSYKKNVCTQLTKNQRGFTKLTPEIGYNQSCADPDPDPLFFGQKDPDPDL